ncbi:MAG: hypothetical protein FWD57_12855 [Polyangiaceae bacterium]|nr:hypothetical protein [Polyangiaceae bacterium]
MRRFLSLFAMVVICAGVGCDTLEPGGGAGGAIEGNTKSGVISLSQVAYHGSEGEPSWWFSVYAGFNREIAADEWKRWEDECEAYYSPWESELTGDWKDYCFNGGSLDSLLRGSYSGCERRLTVDSCVVSTCHEYLGVNYYFTPEGEPPSPPVPFVDAGTIAISGGSKTLSLEYEQGGYFLFDPGTFGVDGTMLTVSATGAEVPAFTSQVRVTGIPQITEPAINDATIHASKDQPMSVKWTGVNRGTINVGLSSYLDVAARGWSTVEVECVFSASDGTGTIPEAALRELRGEDSSDFDPIVAALSVRAADSTVVKIPGWDIVMNTLATRYDGEEWLARVYFE